MSSLRSSVQPKENINKSWQHALPFFSCLCSYLFMGWCNCNRGVSYKQNVYTSSIKFKSLSKTVSTPVYDFIKIFGCLWFPFLGPKWNINFNLKLTLITQYRCLHPSTGKIYLLQHVVFDESLFANSSNAIEFKL